MTALLQARSIQKRFGATVALDGVNLDIRSGEVHALLGENGAGKSTLMKILAGSILADAGEIRLGGERYRPRDPQAARRAGIGMIYQELSLAPHLSVEENILLGMEPTQGIFLRKVEMRRRAKAALEELEHPEIPLEARVGSLPISQQQLVEIARALALGCRVLIFDEPTSSLSSDDIRRLFKLIRKLKAQGCAIVYISHFLEEVREIADRYSVLRDGRSVGSGEIAGTSTDRLIAQMVGRELEDLYPRSARVRGESALRVESLHAPPFVKNASFELRRGEVLGIAGLMGAGRTELLRAIFGLDPVKSGSVQVAPSTWKAGLRAGAKSRPVKRWQQGVGFVSENRKEEGLALNLTIGENLTLSRLSGLGPLGLVLPKKQEAAARRWIDRLGIRCDGPSQPVVRLSGGNQQKVALARLLHHDVDVLLLDEPTRGIDVGSKARIYEAIDELACSGKAILMVSSYLPELLGVCDRIAVMHRGVLGPARAVSETSEHELMLEAFGTAPTTMKGVLSP